MSNDLDPSEHLSAWAPGVHVSPQELPRPALRRTLLDRIGASARAHAEYRTVRHDASPWQDVGTGVRQRWLRQDAAESVALIELEDGAAVPDVPRAVALEDLLTQGGLIDPGTGLALPVWSHAVRPAGDLTVLRSRGTSTLYRRMLHVPASDRPPAEAHWWQHQIDCGAAGHRHGGWRPPGAWTASQPGVTVLPLAAHRHVVSMLVRFEAGAGVSDHGHEIDEDCLVLEGEMFLGDILLRPGDYQLAPAGGTHFGETSDTGVLFFFHGALDPAAPGDGCLQPPAAPGRPAPDWPARAR